MSQMIARLLNVLSFTCSFFLHTLGRHTERKGVRPPSHGVTGPALSLLIEQAVLPRTWQLVHGWLLTASTTEDHEETPKPGDCWWRGHG